MNKYLFIIILVIIGVLIGIVLLDSLQALVFNNNPVIGIQTKCRYKSGILVNAYHCGNGKNITRFKFDKSPLDLTCSTDITCNE